MDSARKLKTIKVTLTNIIVKISQADITTKIINKITILFFSLLKVCHICI